MKKKYVVLTKDFLNYKQGDVLKLSDNGDGYYPIIKSPLCMGVHPDIVLELPGIFAEHEKNTNVAELEKTLNLPFSEIKRLHHFFVGYYCPNGDKDAMLETFIYEFK